MNTFFFEFKQDSTLFAQTNFCHTLFDSSNFSNLNPFIIIILYIGFSTESQNHARNIIYISRITVENPMYIQCKHSASTVDYAQQSPPPIFAFSQI